MKTTTIGDILARTFTLPDDDEHELYLVRDSDVVFYVGRSYDPIMRLGQHLGAVFIEPLGGDDLGRTIGFNRPESLHWNFDVFTVADCLPLVEEHMSEHTARNYRSAISRMEERGGYYKGTVGNAEVALIKHFHPCLNSHYSQFGSPLPEHYLERERKYMRKLFKEDREKERGR